MVANLYVDVTICCACEGGRYRERAYAYELVRLAELRGSTWQQHQLIVPVRDRAVTAADRRVDFGLRGAVVADRIVRRDEHAANARDARFARPTMRVHTNRVRDAGNVRRARSDRERGERNAREARAQGRQRGVCTVEGGVSGAGEDAGSVGASGAPSCGSGVGVDSGCTAGVTPAPPTTCGVTTM